MSERVGDQRSVLTLPDAVRRTAEAAGASGWVTALADVVIDLEREWSVTVGAALSGGTEALVAEANLQDGTPAVLKLLVPTAEREVTHEAAALRLADGHGCARLLREDPTRDALLLERLGRPLADLGLPLARRHEILCSTMARMWRRVPDSGLPTGAAKGRWLVDYIQAQWEQLDRPCPAHVVGHALTCAARRVAAHDDDRAVLVHGDVHDGNALEADDGFKLIDPDGLLAEPEYDLGVLMREDPVELLAGDPWNRAASLASLTGLDPVAVWEWGVVERVSTGLACMRVGVAEGRDLLAAAEHVAG